MRYSSLENDIIKIIDNSDIEDKEGLKEIIKNAIAIINGTHLYHFNGLIVNKKDTIDKMDDESNCVKISLLNNDKCFYTMTISHKPQRISIKENNPYDYFEFELSKEKLELSFRYNNDIISIKGGNPKNTTKPLYTISYYEGVVDELDENGLGIFIPDEEVVFPYSKNFEEKYYKPEHINISLQKAYELSETVGRAPYQKKWIYTGYQE